MDENERFTIRIKPFFGESLSGFLMRVAKENRVDIKDILNYLYNNKRYNKLSYNFKAYMFDNTLLNVIDVFQLSYLTGIERSKLESMTFLSVYHKFFENINQSLRKHKVMNREIIKDKRRFCKKCLKEYGFYKLIWQMKRVEICDIHLSRLTSKCNKCGMEQPYVSSELMSFKCSNCGSLLSEQRDELVADEGAISNQINVCKNCYYILDVNMPAFPMIDGISKEKSLAINALYSLQLENNFFDIDIARQYLSPKVLSSILNLINDNPKSQGCITIQTLFSILETSNLTIEDFSKISATQEYIKSFKSYFFERYNRLLNVGTCQSHWCSSYGSNNKMKGTEQRTYENKYSTIYVCMGCYMKYGYNKKSLKWESIDDYTNIIWNKVLPLINIGMKKNEIIKTAKLPYVKVSKAIAYIASHSLALNEIILEYIPNNIPNDIISCFKKATKLKGELMIKATRMFNWTDSNYYYFFSLDVVQEYFIFNKCKDEGKNNIYNKSFNEKIIQAITMLNDKGLSITKRHISKVLKISQMKLLKGNIIEIINKYKLQEKQLIKEEIVEKVKKFLKLNRQENNKASFKGVCDYVKKSCGWMDRNYPELKQLIKKKVNEHNVKIQKIIEAKQINIINDTVDKLYKSGKNVSYANIAKESCIGKNILVCNPVFKNAILEAKVKYGLN